MSTERLFLVDPYNKSHIEMIKEFEINNDIDDKTSEYLKTISTTVSKEEYQKNQKEKNEIIENLFIERNNKITDCCSIQGEKDIKRCKIFIYPLKNKKIKRKLPSLATSYAINLLGMEEVFISVESTDSTTMKHLEEEDFENLGDEEGRIIYLKEKEDKDIYQRKIS